MTDAHIGRPSSEGRPVRALDWVRLPDGREGYVMLIEHWRGVRGADIAIPGVPGRAWAPVDELAIAPRDRRTS